MHQQNRKLADVDVNKADLSVLCGTKCIQFILLDLKDTLYAEYTEYKHTVVC